MLDRLRLFPTVILSASLLLGLKVVDLATDGEGTASFVAISTAQASAPEETKETAEEGAAKPEADVAEAPVEAQAETPADAPMSKGEIAVLERLSERREELAKRSAALDTREQLLSAAEKRVEDRIAELKALEEKINAQIATSDEQNNEQIVALVSMYEGMKPKDAARIFERLDMGVLLDVVKRMQPRKMSAILAAMDPVVAQDLTVELATGDRLSDLPLLPTVSDDELGAPTPAAALKPAKNAS
jgi:flagellar motility protein MotE (MotC chaperone)